MGRYHGIRSVLIKDASRNRNIFFYEGCMLAILYITTGFYRRALFLIAVYDVRMRISPIFGYAKKGRKETFGLALGMKERKGRNSI